MLEAILAVDRADIPATTQRRTLAQSTRRQVTEDAPTPVPRCAIPNWFRTVLAEAHVALFDAEAREAQQRERRAQAIDAATRSDATLAEVASATAADRDALHHAESRALEARGRHGGTDDSGDPNAGDDGGVAGSARVSVSDADGEADEAGPGDDGAGDGDEATSSEDASPVAQLSPPSPLQRGAAGDDDNR